MKLYKARHSFSDIEVIEAERVNGQSYWTKEGRRSRFNNYDSVFETFDEAWEHLKARLERKISNAQSEMDRCKCAIKELNMLQHP